MSTYYTLLTTLGAALHANAQVQQTTVPWTHMRLGDGNGAPTVPTEAQTALVHQVHTLPITDIAVHPDNPNWVIAEAVVPSDVGGWTVREAAIYGGADGNSCIAVGNYPETYKPVLAEGAGREMVLRMVVQIASVATVKLQIDPAVAIASRAWVESLVATPAKAGLVKFATVDESRAGELSNVAVTPQGLMTVLTELSITSDMVVLSDPGVHTWPVPQVLSSGKKKAYVIVVGGGGGAASTAYPSQGAAGAGAAEGLVDLTGVSAVSISVGAGGNASNSWVGQTSSFGSFMSATGGQPGQFGASQFSSPGQGIGGTLNREGTFGGGADGSYSGEGGASPYAPTVPRSGSGIRGNFPGGGAGAGSSPTGNPGGAGAVIIRW